MSSEARINASRANGAKSHGPITPEGQQASAQNSRKHGLLSKKIVLPGESQEEFDELLASYLDEHQPETPTEQTLIENLAVARWRQQRVWTLETAAMDNQMRHPRHPEGYADDEANDFPTRAYVAFHTLTNDSRSFENLNRYEVHFERQFRAALTAFLNLRAKRRKENPANTPDQTGIHLIPVPHNSVPDELGSFRKTDSEPGQQLPSHDHEGVVDANFGQQPLGSFRNTASEPQNPSAKPANQPTPQLLHPCYTRGGRTC